MAASLALAFLASASAQPVRVFGPPKAGHMRPPLWMNLNPATLSNPGTAPYTPQQVQAAYGFNKLRATGSGQIIGIVDAYDDSQYIQKDLNTFCSQFGIPSTTVQILYAQGAKPAGNSGWQQEISLDVEWAHAIAPDATILLVEAQDASTPHLLGAVQAAVNAGATVVSMSWGGGEFSTENADDSYFSAPGVTFVASAGDGGEGSGVEWPAASAKVLSVGGTTLYLNADGSYNSEAAWSSSGGGISAYEGLPAWQAGWSSYLSTYRGVPDVAYLADPNYGVYVAYRGRWYEFGGTSVGAPQWAALVALANQTRTSGLDAAAEPLYELANNGTYGINAANFHDVASGNNGGDPDDAAVAGYDLVTGLGSPAAASLVPALTSWSATPPSPDFALSVSPSSTTVSPSVGAATYTVTVTALNGFSGTVGLTAAAAGATTGLGSSSLTVGGTSPTSATTTLTIADSTVGTYSSTVTGTFTGTSPALTHQATATLVVANSPTTVGVTHISYTSSKRALNVILTVADNLGNLVANASVSATLNLNGSPYASGTATTGPNGTATLSLRNPRSGTYTTTVTGVSAAGLTWDGNTPVNSYQF